MYNNDENEDTLPYANYENLIYNDNNSKNKKQKKAQLGRN